MKIAFIGAGRVGGALADHLQRAGHDVVLATDKAQSDSIAQARAKNPALRTGEVRASVRDADAVFLATPYAAVEATVGGLAGELAGKIVVDCTNPVGPGLSHGLESKSSGAQVIAKLAPGAKVVKAFTIYGFENFEDPAYPGYGVRPAMLFCGDDAAAKQAVAGLVEQLGWEPVDVGGLEQALHLEHMTLLWVRMVRAKGASPHFVWARLTR